MHFLPPPHLHQGLCCQHMLHLTGANAKGERAEGTVGGGVGVAADNDRAGQGEALMGGRKGEGVSQGRGNRIRVR